MFMMNYRIMLLTLGIWNTNFLLDGKNYKG